LEPVYRRLGNVKEWIRERALSDMGTFDTKISAFGTDGGKAFCNSQALRYGAATQGWLVPMAARSANLT
jgi:hypothetical protein